MAFLDTNLIWGKCTWNRPFPAFIKKTSRICARNPNELAIQSRGGNNEKHLPGVGVERPFKVLKGDIMVVSCWLLVGPRNGRVRAGTRKPVVRQISQARLRPATRRALSSKLDARQFAVRNPSGFTGRPDTKCRVRGLTECHENLGYFTGLPLVGSHKVGTRRRKGIGVRD